MAWKTITRQELYDEVWSEPVSKLSKKYNLSDVGFAKLCKRCDIPRPPRGYWAKLAAGKKAKKTSLPKLEEEFGISVYEPEPGERMATASDPDPELVSEKNAIPKIEVAASLRGAHRLVSATREAYEGASKRPDGILQQPADAKLDLSVSRDQLRRSLLVMDAILKSLEALGYHVKSGPVVTIFEQQISFSIKEAIKTIHEEVEPSDDSLDGRYDFFHDRKRTVQVPSGHLLLLIPEAQLHWAYGCRKLWKDAKIQRIENCLNSFVSGLIEVAAAKRDHKIKEEQKRLDEIEAEKQRMLAAKERAERRKQKAAEQLKLDQLLEQVASWRQSREIRNFVEFVRASHAHAGSEIASGSELDNWLQWAISQADRFDPTVNAPKSILDEVIPDEPRRWG